MAFISYTERPTSALSSAWEARARLIWVDFNFLMSQQAPIRWSLNSWAAQANHGHPSVGICGYQQCGHHLQKLKTQALKGVDLPVTHHRKREFACNIASSWLLPISQSRQAVSLSANYTPLLLSHTEASSRTTLDNKSHKSTLFVIKGPRVAQSTTPWEKLLSRYIFKQFIKECEGLHSSSIKRVTSLVNISVNSCE